MAELILTDAKIVIGSNDYSARSNEVSLFYNSDMLDATVLGDDSRSRVAGLSDLEISADGYWGSSEHDKAAYNLVGSSAQPFSISPNTSAGSVAYLGNVIANAYTHGGTIGDLLEYDLAAVGAEQSPNLTKGKILVNKTDTTGTGITGTSWTNIGVGTTTQYICSALHMTDFNQSATGILLIPLLLCSESSGGVNASQYTYFTAGTTEKASAFIANQLSAPGTVWARIVYILTGGAANPQADWIVTAGIGG